MTPVDDISITMYPEEPLPAVSAEPWACPRRRAGRQGRGLRARNGARTVSEVPVPLAAACVVLPGMLLSRNQMGGDSQKTRETEKALDAEGAERVREDSWVSLPRHTFRGCRVCRLPPAPSVCTAT
ncbi:hypothetical protein PAL_GLEAN10006352 [Pteropus alecto]|uniref:Uncharacterized protein n=1 Tax=Pteropus alecto TaxID=9402 RepID=L5K9Y5_PTEAL|nr:hypothetical protein PAL_GLEAN10006352 [Pteropus alecto]